MKRALIVAIVAGAALGLAVPYLSGRAAVSDLLWAEGLFLAAAWGIGWLATDWRTGAACGATFVAAYEVGRELMPWTGIEADVLAHTGDASLARQFRDTFEFAVDVNWRIGLAAVAIAAVAGSRHPAAWAFLAGALVADLAQPLPSFSLHGWDFALLAAAVAGVYVAARFAKPRWTLALALLPIAVVWAGPHLLGSDVVGGQHPEVSVIR